MRKFNDENFQLFNKTAIKLYNNYAKNMPIIDYHCHLSPKEIYEDKVFSDLSEVWLGGDHYKWRAERAYGISEDYITGSKSNYEKFLAWAEVLPYTIGNPVYQWAHMELKSFFNIDEVLNLSTANKIYKEANEVLETLSARKMIQMNNVEVICTTDDPLDSLEYHKLLKEDKSFNVKVLPAFRPDKAVNIELSWYLNWINDLSKVVDFKIEDINDLLKALRIRIDYFAEVGCKLSDHALDEVVYHDASLEEVNLIFKKVLNKENLKDDEVAKYKTYLLKFFGEIYHEKNWVQQYHIGSLRNNNTKQLNNLGANTGYDAINDGMISKNLSKLLDYLVSNDKLPKTIIYCANPSDNDLVAALINSYQENIPGKMQFGSAWWFNDHKEGMQAQMKALSNIGILSKFVGMVTDSRSFLSYPRHDYFRRILCNLLGEIIEDGEFPNDIEFVGSVVKDICYNNAKKYFEF